jgi:hypothetical protein
MKGFLPIRCEWIARYVQGRSVVIRVNDDVGHYFYILKGLRHGDHLSPILFNIVADMLAILIARAKEDRTNRRISASSTRRWNLYTSVCNTILFMKHDLARTINMKLILAFFLTII